MLWDALGYYVKRVWWGSAREKKAQNEVVAVLLKARRHNTRGKKSLVRFSSSDRWRRDDEKKNIQFSINFSFFPFLFFMVSRSSLLNNAELLLALSSISPRVVLFRSNNDDIPSLASTARAKNRSLEILDQSYAHTPLTRVYAPEKLSNRWPEMGWREEREEGEKNVYEKKIVELQNPMDSPLFGWRRNINESRSDETCFRLTEESFFLFQHFLYFSLFTSSLPHLLRHISLVHIVLAQAEPTHTHRHTALPLTSQVCVG